MSSIITLVPLPKMREPVAELQEITPLNTDFTGSLYFYRKTYRKPRERMTEIMSVDPTHPPPLSPLPFASPSHALLLYDVLGRKSVGQGRGGYGGSNLLGPTTTDLF